MKAFNTKAASATTPVRSSSGALLAWLFGSLIGLALLKFGNPVVMEKFVDRPKGGYELLFNAWPVVWGYGLLLCVALFAIPSIRPTGHVPVWLVWTPAIWLLWEALAATRSINRDLSWSTMLHFASCVACFYVGLLALRQSGSPRGLWPPIILGFVIVLAAGLQQHFGGLEASRRYFFLYVYPQMKEVAPEYLQKLNSDRIFSTLFYPNSLAGAILLFLPMAGWVIWERGARLLTPAARMFLVILIGAAALGCLFWSGSKSGWLIMLFLGLVTLLHLKFSQRIKWVFVVAALALGLTGFFVKYAGFFRQGAKSVGARFDYWEAGVKIAADSPVFGTGPGTFGKAYEKIKRPESEMARLAHNDYLQQATDSGIPGFLLYSAFIAGTITYVYFAGGIKLSPFRFTIWLGLMGWCLQSLVDFGLYIPALAWPAFGFMGWLLGNSPKAIDNPSADS